jgi:hypothetical protein
MALLTLPFPAFDQWQYETTLDETVYQIRGTLISPAIRDALLHH